MSKQIWAVVIVAGLVAIALNVFDAGADGIHTIFRTKAPVTMDGGVAYMSKDGIDDKGYKWVACTDVGDSSNTIIQMTYFAADQGAPEEKDIVYADSLVTGVGFMARTLDETSDAEEVWFFWEVKRY